MSRTPELDKFYSEKFYFSYSSIKKLKFSPRAFYNHYVLKEREDTVDAHLVSGRVLHCLLLEPEKFNEYFTVSPSKFPTASNKLILDQLHSKIKSDSNKYFFGKEISDNLEDYDDKILSLLEEQNLYQKLKTDGQRVAKITTDENKEYFKFLMNTENKLVVDPVTLKACKESVEIIKGNPTISQLMQLGVEKYLNTGTTEILNELELKEEVDGKNYGYRGVLDNVVIDKESKIIFINDLKTTGKPIQNFSESVEFYEYWVQAVIYKQLVLRKFSDILNPDWKIIISFIVIDKYNQVYPFQVSEESLKLWEEKFNSEIVPMLDYHYNSKDFTLPHQLAIGNIKL